MHEIMIRRVELALLFVLGGANVASELVGSGKTVVVVVGAVAWIAWVFARYTWQPQVLRTWGFRADNLRPAAAAVTVVTVPVAVAIVAAGIVFGTMPPPSGIVVVLALYPLWGVVQQFLLNAVLARHLRSFLPDGVALGVAATLFALSHAPDLPLMGLTLAAGAAWVWIYRRWPNLWVLGAAHGVLGTIVYYGILGRDPLSSLAL